MMLRSCVAFLLGLGLLMSPSAEGHLDNPDRYERGIFGPGLSIEERVRLLSPREFGRDKISRNGAGSKDDGSQRGDSVGNGHQIDWRLWMRARN